MRKWENEKVEKTRRRGKGKGRLARENEIAWVVSFIFSGPIDNII